MVRTVDLPDLGAVADASTFVSDHAGTGAHRATSLVTYMATKLRGLWFGAGPPSVTFYGATGNGSTDDSAAITAALAASGEVAFPPGTYRVSNNVTAPKGKTLTFANGAVLLVDSGKVVTIHGTVDAPIAQIFAGAGTVVGIRQVYPEWWGATGDGTGDDQPALAAAHACVMASMASDGGRPTIFLTRPTYQVVRTWTLTPSANVGLLVQGAGTIFSGSRIVAAATFTPAGPVVLVDGNTNSTQAIADWALADFGIVASAGGYGAATIGLQIGSTSVTKTLDAQEQNRVDNLFIDGFPNGLLLCHCRLVEFNRMAVWNNTVPGANTCILIEQNGGFTGDLTFNDVQWINSKSSGHNGLAIASQVGPYAVVAGAATCDVSGLRFNGCIGYACDLYANIVASNGARITDVWLNPGCQFDAGSIGGVVISSSGANTVIENVQMHGSYVDGSDGNLITLTAPSTGIIRDCAFSENWLAGSTAIALIAAGTNVIGLHVRGNMIHDCHNAGGPAIQFSPASGIQCTGNVLSSSVGLAVSQLVSIGLGCNHYVCSGNVAMGLATIAVVNDAGGAVTKSVTGNI